VLTREYLLIRFLKNDTDPYPQHWPCRSRMRFNKDRNGKLAAVLVGAHLVVALLLDSPASRGLSTIAAGTMQANQDIVFVGSVEDPPF
jgi:hypothetical protein